MPVYRVHMLAFSDNPGEIREVTVPEGSLPQDKNDLAGNVLDQVFYWGQNDFQPLPHPSVSKGDVIELEPGKLFMVCSFGFREITVEQFLAYVATPRRERSFHPLTAGVDK
jgi:hypothetical protein